MSSLLPRFVWFLLVDSVSGESYKRTNADKVSLDASADVADFRDAVKAKHSNKLSTFDAADLLVYKNKAAFDEKQEPIDPTESLGLLGSKQDMLVVVVPSSTSSAGNLLTTFDADTMNSIAHTLDIENWKIGYYELDIYEIEQDFPKQFYVRMETLEIIKIFNNQIQENLSTVFVGTPGVGKSMLVVLFAFNLALRQQKRVVLLRKLKQKGLSMLYLDAKNNNYWQNNNPSLQDLNELRQRSQDFVLCLDGFVQKDIIENFALLASFRLLATSVQYDMKEDENAVCKQCLVPFWSKSDLNTIGNDKNYSKLEINERYFYSGGSMRLFLSARNVAMVAINQAITVATADTVQLFSTQYGLKSKNQVDRLRSTTIQAPVQKRNSMHYVNCGDWFCVITSEYALRQLSKFVAPSYYKDLFFKSRMLGEDGLMGTAFENYVHTMARDREMIGLQVRKYDREKVNSHTYTALEFQANTYRYEGRNTEECEGIMQQLADVDYWHPFMRCLGTIDSVAKLKLDEEHNVVALIQITKSEKHKIDSDTLNTYAGFFPNGAIYVALVPDKDTSDNFRLAPVDPPTNVQLYVAYFESWKL
jgi:energy-coupling factor transporter ATP-binding protein EcfA2